MRSQPLTEVRGGAESAHHNTQAAAAAVPRSWRALCVILYFKISIFAFLHLSIYICIKTLEVKIFLYNFDLILYDNFCRNYEEIDFF